MSVAKARLKIKTVREFGRMTQETQNWMQSSVTMEGCCKTSSTCNWSVYIAFQFNISFGYESPNLPIDEF